MWGGEETIRDIGGRRLLKVWGDKIDILNIGET